MVTVTSDKTNKYSEMIEKVSINITFDQDLFKREIHRKAMKALVNNDFNILKSFIKESIIEELTWASYPTIDSFIQNFFSLQKKAENSLKEKLNIAYKDCPSVDTVNETIAKILSTTPIFEINNLNDNYKITFDITPVELILNMAEMLPFEAEIEWSNWDRNQMLQRILEKNREHMVFNYLAYSRDIDYTNDFKQIFYLQYVYENKYSPECLKAFEEACERTLNHYSLSDIKLIKAKENKEKENIEKESIEDIER